MLRVSPERLCTAGEDDYVAEAEPAGGKVEEGRALLRGLYEKIVSVWARDGQDESGEAGAGADIGHPLAGGDLAHEQACQRVKVVLDRQPGRLSYGDQGGAFSVLQEQLEMGAVAGKLALADLDAELGGAFKEHGVPVSVAARHGAWVRRAANGTSGAGRPRAHVSATRTLQSRRPASPSRTVPVI